MIRTSVISHDAPGAEQLAGLKAYASVPEGGNTDLLERCLVRALLAVQERADRSLLPCVLKVEDTEVVNGEVRLYQNVAEVLSVTVDGHETEGTELSGNAIHVSGSSAVVTYHTAVNEGDLRDLETVVFQYATALYDGQTDNTTLNSILAQC